jgi:uncharacterized Actinobacterial protein TIGR03083
MREVPIPTLHLFPALDRQLISLLKSLSDSDWNLPTLAKQWRVKDIAGHLLDGNLRTLSIMRDGYAGDPPSSIQSYQDLVGYLNRLNADWVKAMKRISPRALIDLLESTGKEYHDCLSTLDLFKPAPFPVDWAGESESMNWFHIAREYTEKWHHQKQIREAVGVPGIMEKEFFQPVIQTFMRALPHTYRHTKSEPDSCVEVNVTSEAGGRWHIVFQEDRWRFTNEPESIRCTIEIDPDTAWKLFTKGISAEQAKEKIKMEGVQELGTPILSMLSVMA